MHLIQGLICPFGLTHPSTVPSSSVQVSIDFNGRIILSVILWHFQRYLHRITANMFVSASLEMWKSSVATVPLRYGYGTATGHSLTK